MKCFAQQISSSEQAQNIKHAKYITVLDGSIGYIEGII